MTGFPLFRGNTVLSSQASGARQTNARWLLLTSLGGRRRHIAAALSLRRPPAPTKLLRGSATGRLLVSGSLGHGGEDALVGAWLCPWGTSQSVPRTRYQGRCLLFSSPTSERR
ncbi:hypothetical protein NDU88_003211 [Pleurodeles waltl]|uniref:Uncharacterized protein n=1 Tax=Pleurodeles waltl TaxID=8319 RepID=A0AAV7Q8C0_PLEWA|nr:hypothetical protein NDU88_003211 [Pleurodeles waltl]